MYTIYIFILFIYTIYTCIYIYILYIYIYTVFKQIFKKIHLVSDIRWSVSRPKICVSVSIEDINQIWRVRIFHNTAPYTLDKIYGLYYHWRDLKFEDNYAFNFKNRPAQREISRGENARQTFIGAHRGKTCLQDPTWQSSYVSSSIMTHPLYFCNTKFTISNRYQNLTKIV